MEYISIDQQTTVINKEFAQLSSYSRSNCDHKFQFSTSASADPQTARENRRARTSSITYVCKSIFSIYSMKRKVENKRLVLLYLDLFGSLRKIDMWRF
jgi:hypothetical protein